MDKPFRYKSIAPVPIPIKRPPYQVNQIGVEKLRH